MKKPNKKDRKYYDNFIMMNGSQQNRMVPSRYIKDLEKYIKYLESKVNNGVLDDVSGSKLTTSDAFKATLEWIESDDVWIEDEQGNKVEGLKINGKNLKKYCEPYYR